MTLFRSFFMGGFECADHINRAGERVNLLRETAHDVRVKEDYRLLLELGIRTVREGLCWSSVEPQPYVYDFREVAARLAAAEEAGIQQMWDICHFGYPDDLCPTHPRFTDRFARLCEAFARFQREFSTQPLLVVPINEISFLSWHSGDVRGTVPFAINSGFDIKYHLCKAAIAGIAALRSVQPGCRIMLVEPLIRVHGDEEEDPQHIFNMNEAQFQAMDIIAGRMCPELGGSAANLDILGFNYYWNCQWGRHGPLPWPQTQPARVPLAELLAGAAARYQRPIFIAETGHFGSGRALWLEDITAEVLRALAAGVDLHGVCIYPVIDRPDWDNLARYHDCGLWDLGPDKHRVSHNDSITMLRHCMRRVALAQAGAADVSLPVAGVVS